MEASSAAGERQRRMEEAVARQCCLECQTLIQHAVIAAVETVNAFARRQAPMRGHCYHTRLCVLVGALVVGCGEQPAEVVADVPETQSRLMAIRRAYVAFTESNSRPPRSDKELLSQLGEGQGAGALTSPRDGQPLKIFYGFDVRQDLDATAVGQTLPALAYEQTGADGARWVLTVSGAIHELGEEDFAKVTPPPSASRR